MVVAANTTLEVDSPMAAVVEGAHTTSKAEEAEGRGKSTVRGPPQPAIARNNVNDRSDSMNEQKKSERQQPNEKDTRNTLAATNIQC